MWLNLIELESIIQFHNISGGPIDTMDTPGDEGDAENLTVARRSDIQ